MARHVKNDLLSSLDEAKATARVRSDDLREQRQQSQQSQRFQQKREANPPVPAMRRSSSRQAPVRPVRVASSGERARRSVVPVLFALLVVVAFVAVLFAVRGCTKTPTGSDEPSEDPIVYVSPYDWSNLVREDTRWSYVVDGQVKSRLGIDVSENQGEIDWWQVADDGIDFAMIRLGYRGTTQGDLYLDYRYWENLDGAREAGVDCGVYFFSQATTVQEAREEAEYVLTYLNGTPLEYPVAFDSEEVAAGIGKSRTSGLTRDQMTAIAQAFCERIEAAGYTTMIYGNAHDLSRYRRSDLEQRQLWWAEYGSPTPLAKIDIVMWQYSNEGSVAGISTNVDMNMDLRGALNK